MRKGLQKGFTLIELLVVIAIIAILATVVILNVTGARAKAARAKVAADYDVVAKVAAACVSFDGLLTPAASAAAGGTICATLPGDATEALAATGKYPTATANFSTSWTGTTTSVLTVVVTASGTAGSGALTCGITGCTSTW